MSQAGTSQGAPPEAGGPEALPRSEQFARYARQMSDPARRAELFLQAAHLSEDAEDDTQRAGALYREALEADPHLSPALVALERIYLRASNWRGLYLIYGIHAEALDAQQKRSAQAELYAKMARLARERLGEDELASVCCENLLEAQPGEPEAIRFLLSLHENERDWGAIEALLRTQTPRVADPIDRAELLRILGDSLRFGAQRLADAAEAYREAYAADPFNRGAFQGLASTLREQGQGQALIGLLEEREDLLAQRRGDEEGEEELFELRLGLADLAMGEPARWPLARRSLDAAASLRPHSPQVLRREADLAVRQEEFERAGRTYERLLEVVPPNSPMRADLLLTLAELCRVRLSQGDRAIELLEEAGRLLHGDPGSAALETAQRTLAELRLERGELAEARALYTVLLGRAPPEEKTALSEYALPLAEIHEREGELDEALNHYDEVVAIFPHCVRALLGRARVLYERGDNEKALPAYHAYLETLPEGGGDSGERHRATLRIAQLYGRTGDVQRAEEHYIDLLRRGTAEEPGVRQALARLYQGAGRDDEAAEHWGWLRENLSPADQPLPWCEASENLAWFLESHQQAEEAGALYEEVLAQRPGSILARARLAALCEASGRWPEAQGHYAELLQTLPPETPTEQREEIERALRRAERNAFFEGGL